LKRRKTLPKEKHFLFSLNRGRFVNDVVKGFRIVDGGRGNRALIEIFLGEIFLSFSEFSRFLSWEKFMNQIEKNETFWRV
jgi:hypothetical protein